MTPLEAQVMVSARDERDLRLQQMEEEVVGVAAFVARDAVLHDVVA